MKEPLTFEAGRIVESTQGRDKGRCFIITETAEEGYVRIADGLTHKLASPKKKKTKHLHAKPVLLKLEALRPEGGKLQDSDLRRALEQNGFAAVEPGAFRETQSTAHRASDGHLPRKED